jgi:endonuclease-3
MNKNLDEILKRLDENYGTDYICYLDHENAWQLLFSTIMSAQCTDKRVNQVTRDLYVRYPSVEAFAEADLSELEEAIRPVGFYHTKAKNIIGCAKKLLSDYKGVVPSSIEELTSLPGVGRKTANVIRGNVYGIESIVVDTHVARISRKLGLTNESEPEKIEAELEKVLPHDHWILWNIQIITHGRGLCPARKPHCKECFLKDLCPSVEKEEL